MLGQRMAETVAVTVDAVTGHEIAARRNIDPGGRAHAQLSTSFELAGATVCDLLERADDQIAALAPARVDGNSVELGVGPFQIVTLRLRPSAVSV